MSRIRSIHPGFFTDEDLVAVSMAARLLFLGLGVEADDKGVFEWKPLTIKMRVFPADSIDAAALLAELEGAGAIRSYEIQGRKFGAIRNFRRFQKPKTPNDIHPAPPEILAYVGLISETNGDQHPPFPPKGEKLPPDGEKSRQMEDGGGKREIPLPDGNGARTENRDGHDPAAGSDIEPDPDKQFWDTAKAYLGKSKAGVIGKWVRDHGRETVAKAVTEAQINRAVDPVPYIERVLRGSGSRGSPGRPGQQGDYLDHLLEQDRERARWRAEQGKAAANA